MLLGIDYGKKRIGLALGEIIPKGAGVVDGTKNKKEIISEIANICREKGVSIVVIGMPKKPSGDAGELVPEIEAFAHMLGQESGLKIEFEEEELTSAEAEYLLKEKKVYYDKKSGKVDELAAILILEQYINSRN